MKKLLLSLVVLSAGVAQAQWTEQATGFEAPSRGVNEIDIVNENVVWAVGYDGAPITVDHPTADNVQEFTRTVDGGTTWVPGMIDLGGDATLAVNNLSATSADVAWVSSILGTAGGGQLYKTDDGGLSWNFANPTGPTITTPSYTAAASFQNTVHFFDPLIGIVQGDPTGNGTKFEIYRTTDGGITWSQITGTALPNAITTPAATPEFGYNGGNVSAGNFFWFVTSRGNLYRTADKGLTWQKNTVPGPITDYGGINFSNVNGRVHFSDVTGNITTAIGVLIATTDGGTSYTRYTTADGGMTWTNAGVYTDGYQNMDFIPGTNVLVATGDDGLQYTSAYSTDLGATWNTIDGGTQRTVVAFLDGDTGWAGGFSQDATQGGIFKYTGESLGLPSVAARTQFSATPNPTTGIINVANADANISSVAVYDLLGKQVYSAKFSAMNQVNVDLGQLTTGSYILKATSDAGATQTIKIMKN